MPMPLWLAETIFFALAGAVVLFGLKAVGIFEKYTVLLIYGIVALLAVAVAFALGAAARRHLQSAGAGSVRLTWACLRWRPTSRSSRR